MKKSVVPIKLKFIFVSYIKLKLTSIKQTAFKQQESTHKGMSYKCLIQSFLHKLILFGYISTF